MHEEGELGREARTEGSLQRGQETLPPSLLMSDPEEGTEMRKGKLTSYTARPSLGEVGLK